jgi:uncharacterized protein (TIRG00374 family)
MNRKDLVHVLLFLLGLGILVAMIDYVGGEEFLRDLSSLDLEVLVLIVTIYALSWVIRGLRLMYLVNVDGRRIGAVSAFNINAGANVINIVLPLRMGDVIECLALRRYTPLPKGIAAVVQTRVLDLGALFIFGLTALIFVEAPSWAWMALLFLSLMFMGIMAVMLVSRRSDILERGVAKLAVALARKVGYHGLGVKDHLKELTSHYRRFLLPRPLLLTLTLSVAIWGIEVLVLQLVGQGMGYELAFTTAVVAVTFANISKAVPITPGNIGVFEGVLTVLLVFMGVPEGAALSIAVVDHLILNAVTLVLGAAGAFSTLGHLGKGISEGAIGDGQTE